MNLSSDLLTQFAKITKTEEKTNKETTVYGTAVTYNGSTYVRFDGSELLTPVITTADFKDNERVSVLLKDHTATVTGNLSSPSARNETVTEVRTNVTKVEEVIADVVRTEELKAESARIDKLEAADVDIAGRLTAAEATIKTLNAGSIDVEQLKSTFATIENLDVEKGRIGKLESGVADIDTLIFGSATGTTIQTSFANSVIAQLGDAQIKSAMIQDVSASKITSGDIITNNVRVKSQDGSLIISDETMQISDSTRVRVQIGKDASNDYSINIWDASGNLMFSKGGITDSAIKEAIIRNDMVSDTANIAAHKLDIDSLFEEINGSTNTIKSTKVYLDDKKQTLAVAFKTLDSTVTSQGKTITSQGTAISTIQGQISSKIWQQDITTAKNEMSTRYSTLEQSLNSYKTVVGETYATIDDVEGIEIGGRNMLLNTGTSGGQIKFHNGANVATSGITSWANDGDCYTLTCSATTSEIYYRFMSPSTGSLYGLERGHSYTLSGKAKLTTNSGTLDRLFARTQHYTVATGWTGGVSPTIASADTDEWVSFVTTFTIPENAVAYYVSLQLDYTDSWDGVIELTELKMEYGNKATDWTPAPEDVDSRIFSAESSIVQLSNRIAANVAETTSLGTHVTTVEQTARDLTITLRDLAIGGTNLLSYTKTKPQLNGQGSTDGQDTYLGFSVAYYDNSAQSGTVDVSGLSHALAPEPDAEYTLSFYAKGSGGMYSFFYPGTVASGYSNEGKSTTSSDGNMYHALTSEWKKYVLVWKVRSDVSGTKHVLPMRLAGDSVGYICAVKFEKGNRATDWSPSASEVDDAAKTATNYLNYSGSGLVVGNHTASTLGKNVLIDSEAVKVRTGSTVNAVFGGDIIELAKDNESATISMLKGAFKIYYDADSSDGGFGVYGLTTGGKERLAFQPVNENNNLTLGWGGYADKANSTNLYGHKMYLTTNEDIILNPGSGTVQIDGNVVLSNGKNLFGKRTDGVMRTLAILNASNQMLFGYGSYTNNEGSVYYDGNDVNVRSKNDIRLTTPNETVMLQDGDGSATYSAFFKPTSDAKCTLGTNANRWYAVYASNATIQTSDIREKENVVSLSELHSALFDKLRPVQYNFIDGNGRACYGLIAQEVISAMGELGIGEHELDLVHHDLGDDKTKDTFGLAYSNLIAMLIYEVQKLKREVVWRSQNG